MPTATTTPETAPSATHRSTGQDKLPIPVRIVVDDKKAKDHDDSDLKAQWMAADAAAKGARYSKYQVQIAWVQLIFSFLGAVGLFFSLSYTSRSLRQTKEAMRVNREVGEAQVRAYLGIDKIHILQAEPRIKFDLKNFGHSIAKEVKVTTSCVLRKSGDQVREKVSSKIGAVKHRKIKHNFGIINPSHSSPGLIVVEPIADYRRIVVQFKVSYTDIFKNKWFYVVDYYVTENGSTADSFEMHIVPNSYREKTEINNAIPKGAIG